MTAVPDGWRLQHFAHLPSTQALAVTLAEAGEPEGLAILADRQTAGQATQGRGWESPAGNLAISVLMRPAAPVSEAGEWGILAAVALASAVAEVSTIPPRLKWPNDLLLGGAKAAGILTQAAGDGGRLAWVIIGIGVNLRHAPGVDGRVTACLGDDAPTPEAFAAVLLRSLDRWRQVRLLEGFAPVRAAWLEHGPALGTPLSLSRPSIAGRFEGLAEDGALLLGTGGRVHAVRTGEIEG
ncbi:biotin--[acetyl-CoA-carboxylase] ligase [Humitalea sp. 24SJ18S-53]|uniref:biotin--[acetyl-CoA-carboxylase] ligase n=1 Tax=Humitalea sp. 24SJ18S-53 TaxID=3422307 RepID=UPI003D672009